MDSLLIIQTVSMTLTLCIGLMLALSRLHMTTIVHRYEVSRWMLVAAMFIYSIHYLLQIVFGFRASGDDVGAVVNILFYTPVVYLISFSIVRMTSNKTYTRKYMFFSIISYTTILAIFIVGLSVKKSLHFGFLLHIMGGIFFASIIFAVVDILKEGKSLRRDIESDTAGDLSMFNNYMLTGTFFLLIFSPLMPIAIFSRVLLMIVGPLFLVLLFVFAVNFMCLGFNLRPLAEVLDSHEKQSAAESANDSEPAEEELSEAEKSAIQSALDAWINRKGFSNQDITLGKLAGSVGISTQMLSRYISNVHGVTFRVWLSQIRLEEAKRILVDNQEVTIETIAEECGFASRSYFQNQFKAETGFTPREWRLKMYGS